jgi:two-component system response regulator
MIHAPSMLLVEDSPEDREATMRAFKRAGLTNPIHCVGTGDEALDYLYQRGRYADPTSAPRPSMVLLDLNLPGTDGRAVLAEIKQTEHLRLIPVVILTTSTDERDIQGCYRMGANSYMKKPVNLEGFMKSIQQLKDYWFEVVILPKLENGVNPS